MTKTEYEQIVAEVLEEERRAASRALVEAATSDLTGYDKLVHLTEVAYLQSADRAVSVAQKLIDRLGLLQFDNEAAG